MKRMSLRRSQGGASLVEFCIATVFLLGPAFLLTPVLGKMIAGKHRYEQSLRYAAWERTVWFDTQPANAPNAPVKSAAELAQEIQARNFGRAATPLRADDRSRNRAEDAPLDFILHRPTAVAINQSPSGYRGWFVDRGNDSNAPIHAVANQASNRLGGTAGQGQAAAMEAIETATRFRVNTRALYTTHVSADLQDVVIFSEFEEGPDNDRRPIDLRLDRHRGRDRQLVLLTDTWNVSGPNHAASQARSMLSTSFLGDSEGLQRALQVIGAIPLGVNREIGMLELGKVDPEQVPQHRLGQYR